jgi:hypothetical protein
MPLLILGKIMCASLPRVRRVGMGQKIELDGHPRNEPTAVSSDLNWAVSEKPEK